MFTKQQVVWLNNYHSQVSKCQVIDMMAIILMETITSFQESLWVMSVGHLSNVPVVFFSTLRLSLAMWELVVSLCCLTAAGWTRGDMKQF